MNIRNNQSVVAVLVLSAVIGNASNPGSHKFQSKRLGISVSIPNGWHVSFSKANPDGVDGGIQLFDQKSRANEPTVEIEISSRQYEQVLDSEGFFQDEHGELLIRGRLSSTSPTTEIHSKQWRGVYGVAMCGISDSLGFHAGAGECLRIVLTDGKRCVAITTNGIVDTNFVITTIARSFRFIQ